MERGSADQPIVRCAIYTRQSVVRADDDPALASCVVQREKCLDFVRARDRHGWHALDEHFDDEGHRGADVDRPALMRLVDLIADRGVDRIVVYRLDRLTRSLHHWALIRRALDRREIGLTVVSGGLDTEGGALARMQLNALAMFAELERDMIGERLADSRAAKHAAGHRTSGRITLGYTTEPRTKQLVVVEAEAVVVRWFFTEVANGKTTDDLVKLANRRHFAKKDRTIKAWRGRDVLRLLRNQRYAGRQTDGAPAIHTPIVQPELFDRVQAIITKRQTRAPSARAPSDLDPLYNPFVLQGLLTCGRCGHTMNPATTRRLTKKSATSAPRYYRCRTAGCKVGQIVAGVVEQLARQAIVEPQSEWPEESKTRIRAFAEVWDALIPRNQHLVLGLVFATMAWNVRPDRLDVVLNDPIPDAQS